MVKEITLKEIVVLFENDLRSLDDVKEALILATQEEKDALLLKFLSDLGPMTADNFSSEGDGMFDD